MPKSKVRQDCHSVYVRTNGHVYRPVDRIHGYLTPTSIGYVTVNTTAFKQGDDVIVSHISQTPHCKVQDLSKMIYEKWQSHGMYLDGNKNKPSEEYWRPICV